MTNKKFKLAAMSLALTACVAASPLAANAEAVPETEPSVTATSGENTPTTNETKQDNRDESNQDNHDESNQDNHDESNQDNHEDKQNPADEAKQNPADVNDPNAAVENNDLAAPAQLMTTSLAKAPAAPTAPAEAKTV